MKHATSMILAIMSGLSQMPDARPRKRLSMGKMLNRYKPHQGHQECARRVRQGLAGLNCHGFED